MLKEWVANMLWDGLKLFSGRLHDWAFDPQRAAEYRFQMRQRWYAYKLKADQTKGERDNLRARWFQIVFHFETSPRDAVQRGDLAPAARKMAMDAVERARTAAEWQGPAADRAKP